MFLTQTAPRRSLIALLLFALSFTMIGAASTQTFPDVIPLPDGFQPEGIASGKGTTFYVGSIPTGNIFRGDVRTGEGEVFVNAPAGRSAIGLKYDARSNLLFVAGGETGNAYFYDAETGEDAGEIQLTPLPSFINDVVVTKDAAYFTNSFQASLYRVPLANNGDLPDPLAVEEIPYHKEFEYTTLLKVLIAQGSYEAALALSERLLRNACADGRTGIVIEVSILRALAWQGMRDLPHALADLDQAIRLAEPAGYVRLFLDEGEPMAKLLYQARSHSACAGYAAGLLARMGEAFGKELPPSQLLIEPLTAREVEVLRLIQSGLSNQEIAGRLFISVPTVKCHITHIYGKLGVTSRTQAVLRGKEVGLIE